MSRRRKWQWRQADPVNDRAYAMFKAGKTRKELQAEFGITKSAVAGLVWRRQRYERWAESANAG